MYVARWVLFVVCCVLCSGDDCSLVVICRALYVVPCFYIDVCSVLCVVVMRCLRFVVGCWLLASLIIGSSFVVC